MPETFTIRTGKIANRWLKILTLLQNSPRVGVRCAFKNEEYAKMAYNRFKALLNKYSGQLTMVAHLRGREVYVFKPEHFDKAVIIDEKEDDDG